MEGVDKLPGAYCHRQDRVNLEHDFSILLVEKAFTAALNAALLFVGLVTPTSWTFSVHR